MSSRRKIPPRIPNEEYSVEFGDVNGSRLTGFPIKENKKGKNKKEK